MLVAADRNFYSFGLWQEFRQTGADLLWRVNANLDLPVLRWLPDGSYLALICHPKIRGRRHSELLHNTNRGAQADPAEAQVVRVAEYDIPNREGSKAGDLICVITSILDPAEATAEELAAAYHERWECENLIDEVKTHQRGPARVLRSKSPSMVRQEIWALLLTHYGIRRLMCHAADEIGEDPDRLSFMTRFFQPIPSMTAMMNCRAWRTSAISSISRTASVSLDPVESNPLAATAISALSPDGITRSQAAVRLLRPVNLVLVSQGRPKSLSMASISSSTLRPEAPAAVAV